MKQAYLSAAAETDLADIWVYVAHGSGRAADRLVNQIHRKCQSLAQSPLIGRSREVLRPSLRSFPCGRYVIFYRPFDRGDRSRTHSARPEGY